MDREEKYLDISRKLKNLEPVKASDNFVHNLHSKIVEIEAEKRHEHEKRFDEGRGGFLRNLLGNMQYPWLVPAAGFTVLIFFVFYITFLNKNAIDNNQPILSNQKQEVTEQKNSTSDQNKKLDTEPDKTLTTKEELPGNNIAGDLNTGKNENNPSPVVERKQSVDNNKIELKSTEQPKNEEHVETKIDAVQDFAKRESEQEKIETNGLLATEPPKSESSISSESATPGDSDVTLNRKAKENDSLKQKLDDKFRRINKSNLEKIRKEILK